MLSKIVRLGDELSTDILFASREISLACLSVFHAMHDTSKDKKARSRAKIEIIKLEILNLCEVKRSFISFFILHLTIKRGLSSTFYNFTVNLFSICITFLASFLSSFISLSNLLQLCDTAE